MSDGEEAAPAGLEPGSGRDQPTGAFAPSPGGPLRPEPEIVTPAAGYDEPEFVDELPTVPPASRAPGATLRWATQVRRSARAEPARRVPVAPLRVPAEPPRVLAAPPRVPRARHPGAVERFAPTLHDVPSRHAPRPSSMVEVLGTQPVPVVIPGGPTPRPWAVVPEDDEVLVDYGAEPGPRRPRPRRRGRWAMVLFVLLVAAALALAGTGFAGVFNRAVPAPASSLTTVSLEGDTAQGAFAYLLATSTDANRRARRAVGETCSTQAPETPERQRAAAQLSKAAAMSRLVVALAKSDRDRLLAMPGGGALVALLDRVAAESATADGGYESWIQDVQATGCYSAPTNDLHYAQAGRASAAAAVAQRQLTALQATLAAGQKAT